MKTKNIEKKRVRFWRTKMHKLGGNRDKEKGHIPCAYLFLMGFVIFLLFAGVNVVSAAAPSITNWSSSGGTTTNKDNPQDLIYKVQPEDTITFTVTANETCNFTWEVMLGAKVLQTHEENNTKTSSFTWTVPNKTSTWDIEVEVSNYKPPIGPYKQDHKVWTITTSELIAVNPGEDIQVALDSLPVEGGVVELKEGTWNLSNADTPIQINRSNTTLRGQGKDKTILHATETLDKSLIWVSTTSDYVAVEDMYLHGFNREGGGYFSNLAIWGRRSEREDAYTKYSDLLIDNVYMAFQYGYAMSNLIQYCTVEHVKVFMDCHIERATIRHNVFHYGGMGYVIKFNGGSDNIFTNNIIEHVLGWALQPYGISPRDTITNNIIRHVTNGYGIWMWTYGSLVKGNIIHDCERDGIRIYDSWAFSDPSKNINNITNNLIYNNKGSGIATQVRATSHYATRTANIINNVIYGNGKDGITCNGLLNGVPVYVYNIKNNIIADNKEYGINYIGGISINLSYNDVYNNSLGNYNNTTAGTGDISTDPLFADPENGDFHLKSECGRWDPDQEQWVYDSVTSPCIDAGDPANDDSNEPDYPNGRINLGAYGNTNEASLGSSLSIGTLKGKVTDKDTGLPIEGALIEANFHQATTNSTGDYIITNLLLGNYTVTASKDGYYSSTATAEILENQTTTLNFQLTKDTTPPVISNITISSITSHSALISWDTNEPSTSLVKYGTSSGSYPYFKEDTSYITSHSITLAGLSPNITYYFVVNSTDKANNSAQSGEHSFKTKEPDTTPPVISNITISAITGSTATITWNTDEPATSHIEYGLTTSYGSSTPLDTSLVTEHTQTITGLESNTTYHFRVKSKDASNNEAVSEDNTFTTTEETNLIAYYKFDEGEGTTAYDSSGNGNNGAIYGASWVDGKISKALSFDGSDDYMDLPENIITAPSLRANGSTLIAWVKVEPSLTGRKGIVGTAACTSGWSVFGLDYYNGKARLETYDNTLGYQRIESITDINDGKWHHIAGTYDPSDKKMRIYVDGVLETTSSELVSPGWSTGSSLNFIGKCSMTGDYFFNGTIDEVKIYNRALSAEEILADCQGKVSGTLTGKVTDKDTGLPIVGATVTANSHQTTTNSTGGYTITLPAGNYTLTASKTGYYSSSTLVQVLGNQTTTLNFQLLMIPTTKGDINQDGKVNSLDYSLLVAKWFKTTDITQEDLNKDGIVNVRDLGILMSNWKE